MKKKCVVCGKDPAEGFASIWHNGKEDWYCHPDEGPSCFMLASVGTRDGYLRSDNPWPLP